MSTARERGFVLRLDTLRDKSSVTETSACVCCCSISDLISRVICSVVSIHVSFSFLCCFTSTESIWLSRDGETRTATSTFTQLLKALSTFHLSEWNNNNNETIIIAVLIYSTNKWKHTLTVKSIFYISVSEMKAPYWIIMSMGMLETGKQDEDTPGMKRQRADR